MLLRDNNTQRCSHTVEGMFVLCVVNNQSSLSNGSGFFDLF